MFEATSKKISSIFKSLSGQGRISEKNVEDAVEEIKIALLDADVNLRVVRRFINSTLEEAKGQKVIESINPSQQFTKIVLDKITQLLGGDEDSSLKLRDSSQVSVVLMMGLQGNGKTTSAGKLAAKLKKDGRRVLLVADDLVRPAAIDQLETVAKSIDVPVFLDRSEKNPVKLAQSALNYAKKQLFDTMIVDTSGRMSVDDALMSEIKSISEAIHPVESLFVADSMLGQIAADAASQFNGSVPITGVILTKFDSDTRGGAAMSIASVVHKPIKFIGTGEKITDFEVFHADRTAQRILGMGDVISLVEKAQAEITEAEAEKIANRAYSGDFSIEDYLKQLDMMEKMGGLGKLASMLPGASAMLNTQKIETADGETSKERAIIYSMTRKERQNYRIIGPPRKKRIAAGSGTTIADVERFIRKFEKMKLMMQKVSKNKKLQASMLKQFGL